MECKIGQPPKGGAFETGHTTDYWVREFHKISFPGMDLMEVCFFRTIGLLFGEKCSLFNVASREFLTHLCEKSMDKLESLFSDEQIDLIRHGLLPENYVVHLKYPLEYGGMILDSNMVLMPVFPYQYRIEEFVLRQTISSEGIIKPLKLYIPVPPEDIYSSIIKSSSDDGGGGREHVLEETKETLNEKQTH